MAGYSKTPLAKKLGLAAGRRSTLVSPPPGYEKLLADAPDGIVWLARPAGEMDWIQCFVDDERELARRFEALAPRLADAGMLWISWPKKTSKLFCGLTEDGVRRIGLAAGLVDVKVCAVDDDWSGLKFVRRLRDRREPTRKVRSRG